MDREEAIAGHLAALYPPERWTLLRHVRAAAPSGDAEGLRIFDVVAFPLWRSDRGKSAGIEIKASRADFVRELKQPAKRAPMQRWCSSSFFAVPAPWKRIVLTLGELPEGWGLIEASPGEASIVVAAEAHHVPEPREEMVQALLRAATRAAVDENGVVVAGVPSVPVVRVLSRAQVALACGHVTARPRTKKPAPRAPCFACAEGRPTDVEAVLAALEDVSAEDFAKIEAAIQRRRVA